MVLTYFPTVLSPTGLPSGSSFFLLLGAAWMFSAPFDRAVFRHCIRKIPTLNDDWVLRLSDDGMSSSGKRGEGRLDWIGFSRARRFADGLLLLQGPHLFHWFPDSAPALPSEVSNLVRTFPTTAKSGGALHLTEQKRRASRWLVTP